MNGGPLGVSKKKPQVNIKGRFDKVALFLSKMQQTKIIKIEEQKIDDK
jgi:hypothetical protein